MSWGKKLRYTVGYGFFRVLLAAAKLVPLPLMRLLFSWLGAAGFALARRDCQRAREHLEKAFGQTVDCRRILRAQGRHLGCLLGEALWLAHASPAAVLKRTRFVGLEHLRQAVAGGKGAILVTAHCGNWEWMNLALQAAGIPMTAAGRKLRNPRFDAFVRALRTRFGGEAVTRGEGAGQALLRALGRGRVVGLLIDQDVAVPGVFVPFFGEPAWTPSGAAFLALRRRCPVVVGFARRLADGTMELAFQPPICPDGDYCRDEDVGTLTALLTAHIEAQVRACPEQWVWFHQRWKRKPSPSDKVWCCPGVESPAKEGV
ncbi:MAG: lysophospholipid acyltransferase family protein [Thermoanaerobaculum sp.]